MTRPFALRCWSICRSRGGIATIQRILKPGGVYVISVPHLTASMICPMTISALPSMACVICWTQAGWTCQYPAEGWAAHLLGAPAFDLLFAVAWSLPPL